MYSNFCFAECDVYRIIFYCNLAGIVSSFGKYCLILIRWSTDYSQGNRLDETAAIIGLILVNLRVYKASFISNERRVQCLASVHEPDFILFGFYFSYFLDSDID